MFDKLGTVAVRPFQKSSATSHRVVYLCQMEAGMNLGELGVCGGYIAEDEAILSRAAGLKEFDTSAVS